MSDTLSTSEAAQPTSPLLDRWLPLIRTRTIAFPLPGHHPTTVRTFDVTLLLIGTVVLVLILTTHYRSLWLALLALAARAGMAIWALLKRRRAAAT